MYGLEEGEEYQPWLWRPPEGGVIGKRGLRRLDGYEKASGKAIYTHDIYRPGMLYAKFISSPYAHARIVSMDTSKAEALQGVKTILRYDDPDLDWSGGYLGFRLRETINRITDTANFYGRSVGCIVVAESEEIVDRALRLIEIEWEELPVIIDWDEALKPDAPILRPDLNPDNNLNKEFVEEHGDVEKGFAEADQIIEFQAKSEEDVWAGVQSVCHVAEWKEDYLEAWTQGQSPESELNKYTTYNKCHANLPYRGGTFGGTSTMGWDRQVLNMTILAAKRAQRPVKLLHDESHFHCSGETCGTANYKVGFKNDGTITAVKAEFVWSSQFACDQLNKLNHGSKIPNIYGTKTYPYLNRGPTTCYSHGGTPASVITIVYEHVAAELEMDPTELALINDGCDGEDMAWVNENIKAVQGFDTSRDSLKEILEVGKAAVDWDNKWHAPGTKKLANGKMHGIGFTWCVGWSHRPGSCTLAISVGSDGTVTIIGEVCDVGVNTMTTYAQVVADELGMRYEDVVLKNTYDMYTGLRLKGPGGSSGMVGNINSMARVAKKMKKLMLPYAVMPISATRPAFFPDKKPEDLDIKDSQIFEKANPDNKIPVADLVSAFGRTAHFFMSDYTPTVRVQAPVMIRQCYFMEVEVDTETGQTEVKKVVVVNDAGQVINPDSYNGQQYGGTYMGIGRSNTEQVYYDQQTGVKLNANLIGYPIALMNDVGPIDCHFVETHLGYAAYGSCGVGESPGAVVCSLTAPAIYNAIGKFVDDFPTTPDKILKVLGKA